MEFRPHQKTAFDKLWYALQREDAVLLEAACSAGKTLIFSEIIRKLLQTYPDFRALILTDREILVTQTQEKLSIVAPELLLDIGIVCAGASAKKELEKRVTIASRQSLKNQMNNFPPVNLVVVDECHLLAMPKIGRVEPAGEFGIIIDKLREYNPRIRLLGVTATPYRLGVGYIYGERNRPGSDPYFDKLHHKITIKELLDAGYLAPLTGKTAIDDTMECDLSNVGMVAGEYNLGSLSDVMMRSVHITSAVEVYQEFARNRKKTLAFCVTIDHAEKLKEAFEDSGVPALTIHSNQDTFYGHHAMQELNNPNSQVKVFCSVAKLTTGMDVPSIDCIMMARATKSTALYKQILGRGQRIFPTKTDCLVLDLVGNNNEFGTNLDKLKVKYSNPGASDQKSTTRKECPECGADLHIAIRVCPECEYQYPVEQFKDADKPDMVDVNYGYAPPEILKVIDMFPELHMSKKSEKTLLKVRFEAERTALKNVTATIWLCFPDDGYGGYAVEKGRLHWMKLARNKDFPMSAEEALSRAPKEFISPAEIKIDLNKEYPEVLEMIDIPF